MIEANKKAVAHFEKLRHTIGPSEQFQSGYHQDYPKGSPDGPDSRYGSSKTIGISPASSSARPGLSANDVPRPSNSIRIPSAASGNKPLLVPDHDHSTSSRSNLRIMSMMDITALLHWLQKSVAIVERIESAPTMLSATDIARGEEIAVGETHQTRSQRDELHFESGGVQREQRSRRELRDRLHYEDPSGLLVPAQPAGAGVRRSNSHPDTKPAPLIISNNLWDDPSLGRSYQDGHYSSSDEFDDHAHSRERYRSRSRSRARAHRHRSGSVSPLFDPEPERKLQRLEELELEGDESNARQKFEEERIMEEARKYKGAKEPQAQKDKELETEEACD